MENTNGNKTYLIEDAAKYVGLSRRTFEQMNVGSRTERRKSRDGKMRSMRVFDEAELDRVKAVVETPQHKGAIALSFGAEQQGITLPQLREFAGLIVEKTVENLMSNPKLLGAAPEKAAAKKKIDISAFKDKLILNFTQARQLSGLTGEELEEAIAEGRIKSKVTERKRRDGKTFRRWKIYRNSLEHFCESYFNKYR